jgi:DMATS type aromatic prenyltransferase
MGSFAENKLARLCKAVGVPRAQSAAVDVLRLLAGQWADWPLRSEPAWSNDITDDGTPFELSVAFSGATPSIRILAEAQEARIDPLSTWRAGLRVHEDLAYLPGVDLARFDAVRELFAPTGPATFHLWHAAEIRPDGSVAFKAYLNPQVSGAAEAPRLVREAARRLLPAPVADSVWRRLSQAEGRDAVYFSLDLSRASDARVKIYLALRDVTPSNRDRILQGSLGTAAGDGRRLLDSLVGDDRGVHERPVLVCYSVTARSPEPQTTLHVPVRFYVPNDAEAVRRAVALLDPVNAQRMRAAVEAMADRPLDAGRGVVTYVSGRRESEGIRVTAYLAPLAYGQRPASGVLESPR